MILEFAMICRMNFVFLKNTMIWQSMVFEIVVILSLSPPSSPEERSSHQHNANRYASCMRVNSQHTTQTDDHTHVHTSRPPVGLYGWPGSPQPTGLNAPPGHRVARAHALRHHASSRGLMRHRPVHILREHDEGQHLDIDCLS